MITAKDAAELTGRALKAKEENKKKKEQMILDAMIKHRAFLENTEVAWVIDKVENLIKENPVCRVVQFTLNHKDEDGEIVSSHVALRFREHGFVTIVHKVLVPSCNKDFDAYHKYEIVVSW